MTRIIDDHARPRTYLEHLTSELETLATAYVSILTTSAIHNIDPNSSGGVMFIGFPHWGWAASDGPGEAARMALLRQVRDWMPRFHLLFLHPTPTVEKRLKTNFALLERWLLRKRGDRSVPSTIPAAVEQVRGVVADLMALAELLPSDEHPVRLTLDTNALIDNPDLGAYTSVLGPKYMTHLLPVVLGEIDDLKRSGRTPELREAAQRANTRLKGLRTNGDVRTGARVVGDVFVVFEHVEPRSEHLPSWLDMNVPDDRFVASTLLLQSQHPGSAVYVATGDINMQNKLAAMGLPFVEPPE